MTAPFRKFSKSVTQNHLRVEDLTGNTTPEQMALMNRIALQLHQNRSKAIGQGMGVLDEKNGTGTGAD